MGLYIELLSSVKNQFYVILLFSKVFFFLSGELLILTKNEEHLGFSFVVLIRKNGVKIPITGPAHCSHEQRKHHGHFTPGSIHAGPFVMRTFPQWSDFSESRSVVSDSS